MSFNLFSQVETALRLDYKKPFNVKAILNLFRVQDDDVSSSLSQCIHLLSAAIEEKSIHFAIPLRKLLSSSLNP
jgi:hypothetical protein